MERAQAEVESAESEVVVVRGYLEKRGYFNSRSWKQRYFFVRGGVLGYEHCHDVTELEIREIREVDDVEFRVSDGKESLTLRAKSREERQRWLFLLEQVADGCRDARVLRRGWPAREDDPPAPKRHRLFRCVEFLATSMVWLNAASLALVDYSRVHEDKRSPNYGFPDYSRGLRNRISEVGFWVFNAFFAIEAAVKMLVFRRAYFKDVFNVFDCALVVVWFAYVAVPSGDRSDRVLAWRFRVVLLLRPLRCSALIPAVRKVVFDIFGVLPRLGSVLGLNLVGFLLFCLVGHQLFQGELHGRCRLTPYPVNLNYSYDVHGANYSAFACLDPRDTFTKLEDKPDWRFQRQSPWRVPRACYWPVDADDKRLCGLISGMHECEHKPERKIPTSERRWCGSDFDALGNRRFTNINYLGGTYYYPRRTAFWFLGFGASGATYAQDFEYGFTTFDNFAKALITNFQVVTLDSWTDILIKTQDAAGEALAATYFVLLVLVGGLAGLNVFIAVLEQAHSDAEPLLKKKRPFLRNDDVDEVQFLEDDDDDDDDDETEAELFIDTSEKSFLTKLVESKAFDMAFMGLVLIQTASATLRYRAMPDSRKELLQRIDDVLAHLFLVEFALKWSGLGEGYWRNATNCFRGFVAIWGIFDTYASRLPVVSARFKFQQGLASLFRCLRLGQFIQLSGVLDEAHSTIQATLAEIGAIVALLAIFCYVYALLGMAIFANQLRITLVGKKIHLGSSNFESYANPPLNSFANFDTIGNAIVTVFQLTIGSNWASVNSRLWIGTNGLTAVLYCISIVAFGSWILINLFLSVLIKSASDFATKQAELQRKLLLEEAASLLEGFNSTMASGRSLQKYVTERGAQAFSILGRDDNMHLDASHYILLAAQKAREEEGSVVKKQVVATKRKQRCSRNVVALESKKKKIKNKRRRHVVRLGGKRKKRLVRAYETEPTTAAVQYPFFHFQCANEKKDTNASLLMDPIARARHRAKQEAEEIFSKMRELYFFPNNKPPVPARMSVTIAPGTATALNLLRERVMYLATTERARVENRSIEDVLFSATASGATLLTSLDLERVFKILDPDNVGEVSVDEFSRRIEALGAPLDEAQRKRAANGLDSDEDGIVTFKDFATVCGRGWLPGAGSSILHLVLARHQSQKDVDSLFPLVPGRTLGIFSSENRFRLWCARIVDLNRFKHFVLALIILSCCTILVDHPLTRPGAPITRITQVCDAFFSAAFAIEAFMKIVASGFAKLPRSYWQNGFNRLDFVLVVLSWVYILATLSLGNLAGKSATGGTSSIRYTIVLRILATLRISRVLRVLRILKHNQGLKVVLTALITSLPNILSVGTFVFAVYFVLSLFAVYFLQGRLKNCSGGGATEEYVDFAYSFASSPPLRRMLFHPRPYDKLTYSQQEILGPNSHLPGYANFRCTGNFSIPCCDPFGKYNMLDGPTPKQVCSCLGYTWAKATDVRFDNVVVAMESLFSMASGTWDLEMYAMSAIRGIGESATQWQTHSPAWLVVNVAFQVFGALILLNLFVAATVDSFVKARTSILEHNNRNFFVTDQQLEFVEIAQRLMEAKPKRARRLGRIEIPWLWWVAHPAFDTLVTAAVFGYAVSACITFFGMPDWLRIALWLADWTSSVVFNAEFVLKLAAQGAQWYWRSPWNRFDCAILVVADVGLVARNFSSHKLLRNLTRLALSFRILRLGRIFKRLKRFPALYRVARTFVKLIPAVGNMFLFLALVVFIFAIWGTELFATVAYQGALTPHFNFRTYFRAVVTLLMLATGGGWSSWMKSAARSEPGCVRFPKYSRYKCGYHENRPGCEPLDGCGVMAAYPFVILYICIVYLILLNLFVGVIIEAFRSDEERESIFRNISSTKSRIMKRFSSTSRLNAALIRKTSTRSLLSDINEALWHTVATIEDFRVTWSLIDPDRKGFIDRSGLVALFELLRVSDEQKLIEKMDVWALAEEAKQRECLNEIHNQHEFFEQCSMANKKQPKFVLRRHIHVTRKTKTRNFSPWTAAATSSRPEGSLRRSIQAVTSTTNLLEPEEHYYSFHEVLVSLAMRRRLLRFGKTDDATRLSNEKFVRSVISLGMLDSISFMSRHLDISGFFEDCPSLALAQRVSRQRASLRDLDLRSSVLRWNGGIALADALVHAGCDELRVLRLGGTHVSNVGAVALANILKTSPLEILDLSVCSLDAHCLPAITELVAAIAAQPHGLKGNERPRFSLSLACNALTDPIDVGAAELSALARACSSLDCGVSLRGCGLGDLDKDLDNLLELLGLSNIAVLDLAQNDLQNISGLARGVAKRRATSLEILDVRDNPITDVMHFANTKVIMGKTKIQHWSKNDVPRPDASSPDARSNRNDDGDFAKMDDDDDDDDDGGVDGRSTPASSYYTLRGTFPYDEGDEETADDDGSKESGGCADVEPAFCEDDIVSDRDIEAAFDEAVPVTSPRWWKN
ncbi:hypothetical protein CTAYLR_006031 [Chrysophaeum taylorii]|uniref:Calmodulin n=1 Tax=Chrysophaeum taylorii TaxID=2483200 RepID=A0AAD7ULF1_9STRA|nr:hypothetical protein CTAYLR_006031 [Chrysophaeum taylorii]